MYPDLLTIGSFTVHTYGVCIALGALLGIALITHDAKKEGYDQQQILDLTFYLLIAAIVGSRIFYIVLNLKYYLRHPLETIMIWRGGLVWCFMAVFFLLLPPAFYTLKSTIYPS